MDFTANYDMFLGEEHDLLRKTVRDFGEKEVAPFIREWDRAGAQSEGAEERPHIRKVLGRMAELGLLGICIPQKYGGAGMDYLSLAVVCEELERVDSFLRVVLSVHTGLNSMAIFQWGTEEQKQKYLKPQAEGSKIACLLPHRAELRHRRRRHARHGSARGRLLRAQRREDLDQPGRRR